MRTFKVKEEYVVSGWTYVVAKTEEEAIKILESDVEADFREVGSEHMETHWKTLQEVTY